MKVVRFLLGMCLLQGTFVKGASPDTKSDAGKELSQAGPRRSVSIGAQQKPIDLSAMVAHRESLGALLAKMKEKSAENGTSDEAKKAPSADANSNGWWCALS